MIKRDSATKLLQHYSITIISCGSWILDWNLDVDVEGETDISWRHSVDKSCKCVTESNGEGESYNNGDRHLPLTFCVFT